MIREALGAIRLVRAHPVLSWYLATEGVGTLAWSAAFRVGLVLLVARTLGAGVGAYGLLLGAYGISSILANLVVGSLMIHRQAAALVGARLVLGAGYALVAVAPVLWVAMLGTALAAIGGPLVDITVRTMVQRDLPDDQIGKVYSLEMTVVYGGAGAGLLLSGPFFAVLGPRGGIAACAAVLIAAGMTGVARFGWQGLLTPQPVQRVADTRQYAEE